MRIAYQYHHLTENAKRVAQRNNKGMLLTQFLYNADGTRFKVSTTVDLFK